MKWFKHDANAQSDAKLEKLRIRYGMEGYGLYWYCVELIVGNIEIHNITFQLEHDSEIISNRTGIHVEQVQEIMQYMVQLGLFEDTNGYITCFKLVKRFDTSMTSNPKMREIIKRFQNNHDGVMMNPDSVMQDENRIDENIYKLSNTHKNNKRNSFQKPTISQITEYCKTRNNGIDPNQFYDFYESKNWMIGKTKMKDWQAAIRTWERNQKPKEDLFGDYR